MIARPSIIVTALTSPRTDEAIRAAFVYGSVAKRTDRAGSDIELMVISDSLTYPDVFRAVRARRPRSIAPSIPP